MKIRRFLALVAVAMLVVGLPRIIGSTTGSADSGLNGAERGPGSAQFLGESANGASPVADRSELDRTIAVLEERTSENDTYVDVRTLGSLYLRRASVTADPADYRAADATLTAVNRRDPDDVETATSLAATRLARHDFAGANELAGHVLELDPQRLEARAIEGDAALALGDMETASAAYAQLGGLLPDDPSVAIRLSQLAWVTGDTATARVEALRAVDTARELQLPDSLIVFSLAYAGNRSLDLGDHHAARALLEEAGDLIPRDPGVLEGLGRLAAAEGHLDEAVEHLIAATTLRPDPSWLIELALTATAAGDDELAGDAIATVGAIEGLLGDDPAYRSAFARYHLRWGDPARALELTTAERMSRSDPATLILHAEALAASGQLDAARVEAGEALATGIRDADYLAVAGVIAAAAGDDEGAGELLRSALGIDVAFHPVDAPAAESLLAEVTS